MSDRLIVVAAAGRFERWRSHPDALRSRSVGARAAGGQKGPLYLPQQKKTRVPASPSNPAPDAPDTSGASGTSGDTPGNSPTETSPSETSPPTSDSTPPA